MKFTAKGIPLALKPALQEYDIEKLDPERHAFTIIERTLAYGGRDELRWLFARYGAERIAQWVREAGWRVLPRRRFLFWSTYFGIESTPERKGIWPH